MAHKKTTSTQTVVRSMKTVVMSVFRISSSKGSTQRRFERSGYFTRADLQRERKKARSFTP